MDGWISINGKITPAAEAQVPALDRGLLYGDGVFEVLVVFGDQILDLERHLARLRLSAEALGFGVPWSDAALTFELQALAARLPMPKKYLRLAVTRGTGLSLSLSGDFHPNRYIYCLPAAVERPTLYSEGISLKRIIKGETSRGAAPKTGNYLASVLAMDRAKKEGFDEILWSNADGEITEAATANIFFLSREGDQVEFLTPPPLSGLLLGITRDTLIRLMREAKIPVREQLIFADELPRFDEAFVCSTVRGLVPVRAIDKHRLHSARPQAIFRHIERLYGTWVSTQIGYKVDWASGKPL